ncbi:hypothetical protein C0991_004127 [Blastosporella zonata]|nr:hypothetical protein C0991_004127 [Blastosporella zonata]
MFINSLFLKASPLGNESKGDEKKGNEWKGDKNPHGYHPHHPKVVKGKAFSRLVTIWLENTDYTPAETNADLQALAKQGLSLTNYFAVTHPSEPNYVAAVGGDYFGIQNDDLLNLPSNISTIADLLDDKDISWGEYQEHMPSTGFTGFSYVNQTTGANDYVRKHNPLVIFQSVNTIPERLAKIKNFTVFEEDLAAKALPQWFFMTPNMTNDGHDTNIAFSGAWSRKFIEPLLADPDFNTEDTLIILSFDENATDLPNNRVYTILLGNALPKELRGKVDSTFYTHYSTIATVSANWGLHTLGRWDLGANVFKFVAEKTGDIIRPVADITKVYLNTSYPGIFNDVHESPKVPIPNTRFVVNGRTVLPSIQKQWESQVHCTTYFGQLVPADGNNPPVLPAGC